METWDTRLVRCQLTVKAVPVAHVSFRLHGVQGDAWLLGEDFQRVYLPKVPLTFETWLKLKDWTSIGLGILSLIGFSVFALLVQIKLQKSVAPSLPLILSCFVWLASGLILLARRPISGLILFAVTGITLLVMIANQ